MEKVLNLVSHSPQDILLVSFAPSSLIPQILSFLNWLLRVMLKVLLDKKSAL